MIAPRIIGADHGIRPDARDLDYLALAVESRATIEGPRVGDVVQFHDGGSGRFTYHWGDGIQTTPRPHAGGSFHMFRDGGLSYSGSLDPSVPLASIVDTGETELAPVWFFHHDHPCAHSAVQAMIPCRVYREIP